MKWLYYQHLLLLGFKDILHLGLQLSIKIKLKSTVFLVKIAWPSYMGLLSLGSQNIVGQDLFSYQS